MADGDDKAPGGRVSPAQQGVLDALKRLGFPAAVVRSVRDVEECLAEWDVDGANNWQSIGNLARKVQAGLRDGPADDMKRSGGPGASNTPTRLTESANSGGSRNGF